MKNLLTLFALVFLAYAQGFAQCPDPNFTDDGFNPEADSLPCIINDGTFYSETVQINLPDEVDGADFGVPIGTVTLDSVRIDQINNMPSGINFTCNPPDCVFEGGGSGCITFAGTTSDPATDYVLEIIVTAWVTAPFPIGPQTIANQDISQAGLEYYLTVINPGDPCPNTASPNQLTASVSASDTDLCPSETSNLTVTASNGTTPYTYAWSNGGTLNDATISNPTASPTQTTTYTVTVTDADSETATASVTINLGGAPTADFTFTDQGNGDIDFDASTSTGSGLIFEWDFDDGSTPGTGQTPSYSYATEGTYEVELTVTDDCAATATRSETVEVIFTSINNLADAVNYIKVYPNPNDGNFELRISAKEIKNNYNINVLDLQGKVIYQEAVSSNNLELRKSMNFNHLNSGVYFLHISSEGLSYIERLMIQK